MIDVVSLSNTIIEHPEYIETILEHLGYENIRDRGKYYQFPNKDGDNLTACSVLKSSLSYQNYTRGKSGNLFTLVMDDRRCTFPEALDFIGSIFPHKIKALTPIKRPFGGFYKNLSCGCEYIPGSMPEYNLSVLPIKDNLSKKFFDDGVDYKTQEEWGIRYCHEEDSILIPIYDVQNRLVGCKARNNDPNCDVSNRWWAYLSYQKTGVVYGLNKNYVNIVQKRTILIFEAEKSVLQCCSFGLRIAVAIGGHVISSVQATIIKSIMADKVIVAFDEGLRLEEIKYEAEKLVVDNPMYKNKVGFIYDEDNEYLAKDSKDSPSDNGIEIFRKLYKEKVRWL